MRKIEGGEKRRRDRRGTLDLTAGGPIRQVQEFSLPLARGTLLRRLPRRWGNPAEPRLLCGTINCTYKMLPGLKSPVYYTAFRL